MHPLSLCPYLHPMSIKLSLSHSLSHSPSFIISAYSLILLEEALGISVSAYDVYGVAIHCMEHAFTYQLLIGPYLIIACIDCLGRGCLCRALLPLLWKAKGGGVLEGMGWDGIHGDTHNCYEHVRISCRPRANRLR